MNTLVSFIYVNYNSGTYLSKSIESLLKFETLININFEIIVIDNNSNDKSADLSFKNCKIFKLNENLGFAKANNFAVSKAQGNILYFINPDTIFLSLDLQENINLLLNKKLKIGIISPLVKYSNNKLQYTCRKEPSNLYLLPYLIGFKNLFHFNYKYKKEYYNSKFHPDWVSGCAFMMTKDLYLSLNGFNERFFLYWEDVDLCKRVRNNGYKVLFNPNHTILHYENISAKKVKSFSKIHEINGRLLYFYMYKSRQNFYLIYIISLINILLLIIYSLFKNKNDTYEYLFVLKHFIKIYNVRKILY